MPVTVNVVEAMFALDSLAPVIEQVPAVPVLQDPVPPVDHVPVIVVALTAAWVALSARSVTFGVQVVDCNVREPSMSPMCSSTAGLTVIDTVVGALNSWPSDVR